MSSRTGWGVFGANLALELTARGILPVPFIEPLDLDLPPEKMATLAPAMKLQKQATAMIPPETDRVLTCPYPLLHALGNGLTPRKSAASCPDSRISAWYSWRMAGLTISSANGQNVTG